ncbi:S41 family peptidase [Bacillus coahuilensis]|uniref:S41 family peptidase n=1 Tax=Bacillus coahuilensis TaxID=408580 RepID=UPI000A529526|nr:S41 family peptidase [Bacillus coahuilensis]
MLVVFTAGITTFALTFGDEKAVEVGIPPRLEFDKLYEAYDQLQNEYYTDVNQEELVNGAINGMLDALEDPYSDYMSVSEAEQFNQVISSSFEGIGAEIQEKDGYIIVVSPIKGSPAEQAGLLPNDKILEVDGESIQGMSSTEAVMLIRGEKGSDVSLTIERPGTSENLTITITRDEIPIQTVYSEMKDSTAIIQITSFSENTYSELLEALDQAESEGMEKLIIDVRQNPGGLLDQAIEIANLFIPEGQNILQIEDRDGVKTPVVAEDGRKVTVPTVMLIDEGSASASEILAGAAKESGAIELVGVKTFGKGTVQTTKGFNDGSNMKYTTSKWLTPDGNWIHETGIEPDHVAELPNYASLSYINPDEVFKEGDVEEEIKVAEEVLTILGYEPGDIDGLFSAETTDSLLKFQSENSLEETGVLEGETTYQLMTALRSKLKEDDPQINKARELLGDTVQFPEQEKSENE